MKTAPEFVAAIDVPAYITFADSYRVGVLSARIERLCLALARIDAGESYPQLIAHAALLDADAITPKGVAP